MKWTSIRQWSPTKRGIVAASLAWGVLGTQVIISKCNYYQSMPYRAECVVRALEANELQTARNLLREKHDWNDIIDAINMRHDARLWQRALDARFFNNPCSFGEDHGGIFEEQRYDAVHQLLADGAQPRFEHLVTALQEGDEQMATLLLAKGAPAVDPDHKALAVASAAYHGYAQIIPELIRRGASVNNTDDFGYHPLDAASCGGSTEVTKILLQHGADPFHSSLSYNHQHYLVWESIRDRARLDSGPGKTAVWKMVKPIVEKRLGHTVGD